MRAKKIKSVAILLLFFSSLVLAMNGVNATSDDVHIKVAEGEAGTFAGSTFGPGSDIPLISPTTGPNYYFQFSSEPLRCEWTIMDPTYHIVYIIVDDVTPIDTGDSEYPYGANSHVTFTVPAFAAEGTWVAIPTWVLQTEYGEYAIDEEGWGIPVGPGDMFTNIFVAPLYVFGVQLPAAFWCLSIVWIPLIVMGLLFVYARSAEGVAMIIADARDAGSRAREEWQKKKAAKEARK
jgi:hypothetical protein